MRLHTISLMLFANLDQRWTGIPKPIMGFTSFPRGVFHWHYKYFAWKSSKDLSKVSGDECNWKKPFLCPCSRYARLLLQCLAANFVTSDKVVHIVPDKASSTKKEEGRHNHRLPEIWLRLYPPVELLSWKVRHVGAINAIAFATSPGPMSMWFG